MSGPVHRGCRSSNDGASYMTSQAPMKPVTNYKPKFLQDYERKQQEG